MTVNRDISEDPIRQDEERFKAVSEMTSDYCYSVVVDENGCFRNEWSFGAWEKITGFKPNEIWDKGGLASLIHPEDIEKAHSKIRLLLQGQITTAQLRIISKSGEVKWMEDTARPVWNDDHTRVVRILGSAKDITDRVFSEERLRETQKMESIGILAGGFAHDFNNILGGIIGCAELAKLSTSPGSEIDRYMDDILAAGERAGRLIKQILTFSQREVVQRQTLNIGPVVLEAAHVLRAGLPHTIEIETEIEQEPLYANFDPAQLNEIIINLGTNAMAAMERDGKLRIICEKTLLTAPLDTRTGTAAPGDYILLRITDTGCGMDPETLSRAFEPFFSTKTGGRGTGLGLSVVFGIVKSHGGFLSVKSTVGNGCSFDIYLKAAAAPRVTPPVANSQPATGTGEHILFVDDEQLLCDVQTRVLEGLGYRVTTFNEPRAALEAYRQCPEAFDLIITDQSMPTMSGIEFSTKVLELKPDAKIILCTGFSNAVTASSAAAMGIKGFLAKPFRKAALAKTVRSLIED